MFRLRRFHTLALRRDLFGGTKQINHKQVFTPPTKAESASNPADLFKKNDILMYCDKPVNYIETVNNRGFHLANSIMILSPDDKGNHIGALLFTTETYEVNLSNGGFKIDGVVVHFDEDLVLSVFEKMHPKPEIICVGVGSKSRMLSPLNRKFLSGLGIQIEVGDSRRAASLYDLLATERPNTIAGLLLPPYV